MRCSCIQFRKCDAKFAAGVAQRDNAVRDGNAPAYALLVGERLAAIDGFQMLWMDNTGVGIAHAQATQIAPAVGFFAVGLFE